MNSTGTSSSLRRLLLASGLALAGLTSGALAQSSTTEVNNALADLYPSTLHPTAFTAPTYQNATAAELQSAFQLIAAPAGTTVIGAAPHNAPSGHAGFAAAADIAGDVPLIIAAGSQTSATLLGDLLKGFDLGASPSDLATYMPAVAASVAAFRNFNPADADTDASTLVGTAITDKPTELAQILDAALAVTDPNPTAQEALFLGKASTANLNAASTTLGALAVSLGASGDIGGGVLTSSTTAAFLEALVKGVAGSVPQESALANFVAGMVPSNLTASQLATTATNIIADATSAFTSGSRVSVLVGLVSAGSNEGLDLDSMLPGVVTGILVGQTYASTSDLNDTARTSLVAGASGMIDAFPLHANTIATAAIATLQDPNDATLTGGVFGFALAVVGNANVKNGSGVNSIASVTQSMGNTISLGDITSTGAAFTEFTHIAQAGMKEGVLVGGTNQAGVVAAAVANAVLTSGSGNAAKAAFAANFIGAIDTTDSGFPITPTDRAAAAIGLIQNYNSIPNLAVLVSGSAVVTYASSAVDVNDVAQPILNYMLTVSSTETGAAAAQIVKDLNGVTYGPAATPSTYTVQYLSAQLILAAKSSPTTVNVPLLDAIALGVTTDSVITTSDSVSADNFLTSLSGQLSSAADLSYLKDVAIYLPTAGAGFTDTELISDFISTGGAPAESGTLAALVTQSFQSDATAIAYAAANASGVSLDSVRDTIALDVLKNDAMANISADAVAISGSVGQLISIADKGVFAETLTKQDTNVTDDSNITLAAVQSIPSTDSTLITDIANVEKTVLVGFAAANKTAVNVTAITLNLAANYGGTLSSHPGTLGGYTGVATLAGTIATDEPALLLLGNYLANALVPFSINAAGDNPGTAGQIAAEYETELPSSALAITAAATSSTLYSLNAEQSGTIGSSIAAAYPTTGALAAKAAATSGSISVISAIAGTPSGSPQSVLNTSLQAVADVFASSSVPSTDYTAVATSLSTYAMVTGGSANAFHYDTIPAIVAPFVSSIGASETAAAAFLAKVISSAAGDVGDYENAADVYGVLLEFDSALQVQATENSLVTAIGNDIGTAGFNALVAFNSVSGPFHGETTLTQEKFTLTQLLDAAQVAAQNLQYGNISANETPIVNM